jgi:predicted Zn-dependent protease
LRLCRADLRQRTDDKVGALADAAEAVILDRSNPAAKALLGVMLLEHNRPEDALVCLAEAVAAAPTNPFYCQGLAAAQEANGSSRPSLRSTPVLRWFRRGWTYATPQFCSASVAATSPQRAPLPSKPASPA